MSPPCRSRRTPRTAIKFVQVIRNTMPDLSKEDYFDILIILAAIAGAVTSFVYLKWWEALLVTVFGCIGGGLLIIAVVGGVIEAWFK